jgi:flagellar biosynthesis/type III secretory pathway chaperone
MSTQRIAQQDLRELVRTFEALRGLHEQLIVVVESKIAAMKSADSASLQVVSRDEQELLKNLAERDAKRASLMQSVARKCGMTAKAAKSATVSQIGAFLPAAERELLQNAASRLQPVMARAAQVNRIAGTIARQVTSHMKFVFSALRPARSNPVGYGRRGETFAPGSAIVDVVG